MLKNYVYLLIDLSVIVIPLAFSFYKKYPFYKEWKYFFPANLLITFLFIIWDYWFTKIGVWGFNSDYLTGLFFFNLPLEEVLFFICIPYACLFTYFAMKKLIFEDMLQPIKNLFAIFLLVVSIGTIILFYEKKYTFYTALFLSLILSYTLIKKKNINFIVISYIVIIPFFFLSNGLLTGFFMEKPVVWYNDNENLGVRMLTIPIEDMFYGFLLILMNVLGYDFLKRIATNRKI